MKPIEKINDMRELKLTDQSRLAMFEDFFNSSVSIAVEADPALGVLKFMKRTTVYTGGDRSKLQFEKGTVAMVITTNAGNHPLAVVGLGGVESFLPVLNKVLESEYLSLITEVTFDLVDNDKPVDYNSTLTSTVTIPTKFVEVFLIPLDELTPDRLKYEKVVTEEAVHFSDFC